MEFNLEHRVNLSYEEFSENYLFAKKPVVITDVLQNWKALVRWTPEFFKTVFGDMTFVINGAEYGQTAYATDGGTEFTMARFIDCILQSTDDNPAPYFRNRRLYELFPSLVDDVQPLPEYLFPNWLSDQYLVKRVGEVLNRGAAMELYIGGRGAAFPVLHFDGAGTHAFLMQIYGRKQYVLFAPDQERFLYPSPQKGNLSLINSIDTPDLTQFPLFSRAQATTVILEPGELLFVPSHWWHTAKMLTPSITVSLNVLNESNWDELVSYVASRQSNPLVTLASRLYLGVAGAYRVWRDRYLRLRME